MKTRFSTSKWFSQLVISLPNIALHLLNARYPPLTQKNLSNSRRDKDLAIYHTDEADIPNRLPGGVPPSNTHPSERELCQSPTGNFSSISSIDILSYFLVAPGKTSTFPLEIWDLPRRLLACQQWKAATALRGNSMSVKAFMYRLPPDCNSISALIQNSS